MNFAVLLTLGEIMVSRGRSFAWIAVCLILSSCFGEKQLRRGDDSSALNLNRGSGRLDFSPGPRALKVIFRESTSSNPSGSFNLTPTIDIGTPLTLGDGHPVVRYFEMDGSTVLADQVTSPDEMPPFIDFAEVTLSGSQNNGARQSGCSSFTPPSLGTIECKVAGKGASDPLTPCGPPSGFWAINEQACLHGGNLTRKGNGSAEDPVRFLMKLKLNELSSFENLRVTFTYIASTYRSGGQGQTPISCFPQDGNGVPYFDLAQDGCTDLYWQAYVSDLDSSSPQALPVRTVIPPVTSQPTNGQITASPTSSQVIIPLARLREKIQGDSVYFMLSRVNANSGDTTACRVESAGYSGPQLTALCHGVVMIEANIERF